MARTLDLYGGDTLTDVGGQARAWRKEIAARLAALQRGDGSWVNERAERWWEGNPVLATAYALLALEYCR
jgi:squalene-hopene/tetraprenyl-beta-curcumene cyclase